MGGRLWMDPEAEILSKVFYDYYATLQTGIKMDIFHLYVIAIIHNSKFPSTKPRSTWAVGVLLRRAHGTSNIEEGNKYKPLEKFFPTRLPITRWGSGREVKAFSADASSMKSAEDAAQAYIAATLVTVSSSTIVPNVSQQFTSLPPPLPPLPPNSFEFDILNVLGDPSGSLYENVQKIEYRAPMHSSPIQPPHVAIQTTTTNSDPTPPPLSPIPSLPDDFFDEDDNDGCEAMYTFPVTTDTLPFDINTMECQ